MITDYIQDSMLAGDQEHVCRKDVPPPKTWVFKPFMLSEATADVQEHWLLLAVSHISLSLYLSLPHPFLTAPPTHVSGRVHGEAGLLDSHTRD